MAKGFLMNKFEAIYRRKSVRTYSSGNLSENELIDIRKRIKNLNPLYEDIDKDIILAEEGQRVKNTFPGLKSRLANVEAPHYVLGTSEMKTGYLVNMGFLLEELVLSLTARELGTCWLGVDINEDLLRDVYGFQYNFVIMIALGNSNEKKKNLREDPKKAKRKPAFELVLNDFSELSKDWQKIIDAVRMAPSSINSQPWRFYFDDRCVHLFIKKGGFFKSLLRKVTDLNKLNRIDAGIALKHLEIAAEKYSLDIVFEDLRMEREGMEYIISIA